MQCISGLPAAHFPAATEAGGLERGYSIHHERSSPLVAIQRRSAITRTGLVPSDADRAVVSDVLSEAYALGQLDVEEFDERTEAAAKVKTLGEVPALIEDLVLAESVRGRTGQARRCRPRAGPARLEADRVPITPEQIDAAAQQYYRDRVRRAPLGPIAGPGGITLAIWAFTSIARGAWSSFFWPIFVIVPMLLGGFGARVGAQGRDRSASASGSSRAGRGAHLGDAEARREARAG
jgi:hypothetical protein